MILPKAGKNTKLPKITRLQRRSDFILLFIQKRRGIAKVLILSCALHIPSPRSRRAIPLICMRKDQAFLRTRNPDEIGAPVFILIAKKDFVFDGHNDDRIKLKALALMDG